MPNHPRRVAALSAFACLALVLGPAAGAWAQTTVPAEAPPVPSGTLAERAQSLLGLVAFIFWVGGLAEKPVIAHVRTDPLPGDPRLAPVPAGD